MDNAKRRRGDRRDGRWLREEDSLHQITPYLMPNRGRRTPSTRSPRT